ncbi:hypothetical protein EVAR_72131_1 [Eumeta japonica]|uniref:Uncharacterized protein n=1 Tax=Eumeta variegata TaxID=151549 RepID=A0A4C1T2C7_EUMVA|nr:hypothetical protein EVAR_72131_1 [Eumeta japonica]
MKLLCGQELQDHSFTHHRDAAAYAPEGVIPGNQLPWYPYQPRWGSMSNPRYQLIGIPYSAGLIARLAEAALGLYTRKHNVKMLRLVKTKPVPRGKRREENGELLRLSKPELSRKMELPQGTLNY